MKLYPELPILEAAENPPPCTLLNGTPGQTISRVVLDRIYQYGLSAHADLFRAHWRLSRH